MSSSATNIEVSWDPAYDDGGSPLKQYQLYWDIVEGVGVSNVENWALIYTGNGLTFNKNTAVTALARYRFKVVAINEQLLQGVYSSVSVFRAAAVPNAITFPVDPFETTKTSIQITWDQPTINVAT